MLHEHRLRYAARVAVIGYARVSTRDQNPDSQTDLLEQAGCDRVFVDKASGVLASRPKLDQALEYLRAGDVLVVTKLDRLSRSMRDLQRITEDLRERGVDFRVLSQGIDTTTPAGRLFFHIVAAMSEFEHDLAVERTHEGLAAARARGRHGGRRPKLTPTKRDQARLMYESQKYTVQQIADALGVSRATIYRHLGAAEERKGQT